MAFNNANLLQDFRNGLGYIYITKADGTTIVGNISNDPVGADEAQRLLLTSCPLGGEIASVGTVTFTNTINGTLDSLTVNGVDVIGSVASGVDDSALAIDARDKINAYTSSPNYIARSLAGVLYIFTIKGAGTSANGFTVVSTSTDADTADTDMAGGNDGSGIYDPTYGLRAWLNADYDANGCSGEGTATEGDLTYALEITKFLVERGFQNAHYNIESEIELGVLSFERVANIQNISVQTDGSIAADDLQTILTDNFNDGDIIILTGEDSGNIVTVKSYVGSQDNIYLANDLDWDSGEKRNVLALQYWNTVGGGFWFEMFRSPSVPLSVAALRGVGIAEPKQGVDNLLVSEPAVTRTITVGVWREYIIIEDTRSLAANYAIELSTTDAIEGDRFHFDYIANITNNGFSTTIAGIVLTDTQALGGTLWFECYYDGSAWESAVFQKTDGVDLVDTVALATKEDLLPTPTADAMVLAGNMDDTKYWIPNTNQYQWYIATYDFTLDGGAIGTIDLGITIPAEAVVLADLCFIKTTTIFTSAGAATVEIGLTGGNDDIDGSRAYTVSPYNSTSGIAYAIPPVDILRLSTSSKNVTLTITAANLTAGVAKIYIATVLN